MNTQITYEKATENDIDYLLDLRTKTMVPHYAESNLSTDRETTLQRVLYQFEKAHIIFHDHRRVGLLKVNETKDKTEVIQLQIDPEFQGRGLGKIILQDILDKALETGKKVWLSVLKTNKAQHLYTSLGFKIIGEDEHSYFMEVENPKI
jgi:ribosomal protein S18 acetylase RimI-like enzyme